MMMMRQQGGGKRTPAPEPTIGTYRAADAAHLDEELLGQLPGKRLEGRIASLACVFPVNNGADVAAGFRCVRAWTQALAAKNYEY